MELVVITYSVFNTDVQFVHIRNVKHVSS